MANNLTPGSVIESSKEHFALLDGLRGAAALAVLLLHTVELVYMLDPNRPILPHGQLAVDFFFVLSGFVIAHAYDDRWQDMSIIGFFRNRLVRLHPMVGLGVAIGVLCYVFNPFIDHHAQPVMVAIVAVGCLFLIPTPTLPGRFTDTHSLNGPTWTLLQEYIGNIAYALVLRKLSTRALFILMCLAGSALVLLGMNQGGISRGWGWDNIWQAPIRLAYPFICGLWLYRVRSRLAFPKLGFIPLAIILYGLFSVPPLGSGTQAVWNGIYEAGCILLAFPIIVLLGAHSKPSAFTNVSRYLGNLSYPLYVIHYPFYYLFLDYINTFKPDFGSAAIIGGLLCAAMIALATIALRFWDEPVRARFKKMFDRTPFKEHYVSKT